MSWQTKGKVEIYGQGGACDRSRVEVSRAFPSLLAGYIPPKDWDEFLDKLDVALEPAQKIKDLTHKLMIVGISVIVITFIWGCISFANFEFTDNNIDDFYFVFFLVMGAVGFLFPLFVKLKTTKIFHEVRNVMVRICDEVSNKYPQIEFNIRFDSVVLGGGAAAGGGQGFKTYNYIEVSMAPSAMPTNPVPGQFPGVPIVNPMMAVGTPGMAMATGIPTTAPDTNKVDDAKPEQAVSPETSLPTTIPKSESDVEEGKNKKSPVERLQDLEKIKDLIGEDEYFLKKQEILDSI